MARAGITTDEVVLRPGADDDPSATAPAGTPEQEQDQPLLDPTHSDDFLRRWTEVQARFVDDPQAAVRDADSLVVELVQALASSSAQHREALEQQWRSGGEPGTEELRQALQQYRSFFQRLLHT